MFAMDLGFCERVPHTSNPPLVDHRYALKKYKRAAAGEDVQLPSEVCARARVCVCVNVLVCLSAPILCVFLTHARACVCVIGRVCQGKEYVGSIPALSWSLLVHPCVFPPPPPPPPIRSGGARVNSGPPPLADRGHDHFLPKIARKLQRKAVRPQRRATEMFPLVHTLAHRFAPLQCSRLHWPTCLTSS